MHSEHEQWSRRIESAILELKTAPPSSPSASVPPEASVAGASIPMPSDKTRS